MSDKLYPLMGRWAQRRFLNSRTRYGKKVQWRPSSLVVKNLMRKTGETASEIVDRLKKERREMLREYGLK